MQREIQPGDYILITTKYTISGIEGNEILFYGDDGEDVATFNFDTGKYMVGESEVTGFEPGVQVPQPAVRPQPIAVSQPAVRPQPIAVPQPAVRPQPIAVPQPAVRPQPVTQSHSSQDKTNITYESIVKETLQRINPPPQIIEPGRTGKVSGLGAQYNDDGEKVRKFGTYSFKAIRSLRKGSNVILQLDDGQFLTIRWRSEGTVGRGWFVRYKESGRYIRYHPIDVFLD